MYLYVSYYITESKELIISYPQVVDMVGADMLRNRVKTEKHINTEKTAMVGGVMLILGVRGKHSPFLVRTYASPQHYSESVLPFSLFCKSLVFGIGNVGVLKRWFQRGQNVMPHK